MKLFIFVPSEKWEYCGGAKIAIAEDYKQAVSICQEDDGCAKFYLTENDVRKDKEWDNWVLLETFDVTDNNPRIVVDNYNWA